MKVADVMTTDVDCCTPESSCKEAAIKMRDLNVGVIPICRYEKLLGVVTDRDLVMGLQTTSRANLPLLA